MSDPEDRPPVLRARLTELRASKYYLECEKNLTRASIRVLEARLGEKPRSALPILFEEERTAMRDSQVAMAAVKRAQAEHATVLERERDKSADETAKVTGGEE